jgi:hypothetical protein
MAEERVRRAVASLPRSKLFFFSFIKKNPTNVLGVFGKCVIPQGSFCNFTTQTASSSLPQTAYMFDLFKRQKISYNFSSFFLRGYIFSS